MPDEPRALIQGQLRMSPALESKTCETLLARWDAIRKEQGWRGPGEYERGSYLWQRYIAQRQYEYDFSHRKAMEGVFALENLTLNMPKDFIDQHANRAEQDLLGGDQWFGVKPEGPEDQDPALKLFERYLQRRAEEIGLRDMLKIGGIKGSLIRGDTIYKATDKVTIIRDTRELRVVVSPDDTGALQPVRDFNGELVTELDEWGPKVGDPSKIILLRDPRVSKPSSSPPLLSATTMKVLAQSNPSRGCLLQLPYFADVGFPLTDPDIRQSDLVGHLFDMAPDDLMGMLPPSQRTDAFKAYFEALLQGTAGVTLLSDERTAILARGEEDRVLTPEDNIFAPRRYVELWGRVEVTEEGTAPHLRRREDIMMLVDYDLKYPIMYGYKWEALPWAKNRRNPFGVIRINPREKRATGMGYYEEMEDPSTFADKQHNRISIAIGLSGNQLFEDRSATTNRQAGKPLRFRSPDLNNLNPGRTSQEALSVVTIPCEIKEITAARDLMLNRMQAMKGIVTPATAGDSGFAAADTLGGMQILEKTSDVGVKQIEAHLMGGDTEGITAALRDFAEIEAFAFDPLAATKQFSALGEAQKQAAAEQAAAEALALQTGAQPPPPLDPSLVPQDNVDVLQKWLAKNPDNLRNRLVVVLSPKNGSQIVSEAQQSIQVGTQWLTLGAQFGPEAQMRLQPLFKQILTKLEVQNIDQMLRPSTPLQPPPATTDANGQPQQPAQPQPGSGGPPPITPAAQPLKPASPGEGFSN